MTKRNSKTAHIVAALALSAGLFSAANASNPHTQQGTDWRSCFDKRGPAPGCSTNLTNPLSASQGEFVHFGAVAWSRNTLPSANSATLRIRSDRGIIYTTIISSPATGAIQVPQGGRKYTANIVALWNDPLWGEFKNSGVYVGIGKKPWKQNDLLGLTKP